MESEISETQRTGNSRLITQCKAVAHCFSKVLHAAGEASLHQLAFYLAVGDCSCSHSWPFKSHSVEVTDVIVPKTPEHIMTGQILTSAVTIM